MIKAGNYQCYTTCYSFGIESVLVSKHVKTCSFLDSANDHDWRLVSIFSTLTTFVTSWLKQYRYISSAVLIGLCSLTSGPLLLYPRERYAFTGAFYYGVFSAGLYFIVASLMVVTVWGASKGYYPREFQLTMSQRTLMLQTISFLVYLLCGAAVFSRIEGWTFLESVYWADFTLLTVGIGDFAPTTHTGRSLLFPYAIGGIIILGLVIGSIRSLVLDRGKVKLGARMMEKERRRLIKRINKEDQTAIIEPIVDGKQAVPRASTKKFTNQPTTMNELQRREQEFHLMRRIQKEAATRRRWTSLVISGITWLGLWLIGGAIFQFSERTQNWSYFGALYFSYTSLLTIGYGDFRPQSNSGKAFFVFWSLLAVPSLTILISNMGDTIIKGIRDLTLLVGQLTVLPGEKGERGAFDITKELISNVTHGGKPFARRRGEPFPLATRNKERVERPASSSSSATAAAAAAQSPKTNSNPSSPKIKQLADYRRLAEHQIGHGGPQYHLHLAREIADVMTHLNAKPARQYTYEEWAWYLKLIGEDEADERTHRRAEEVPVADGGGVVVGQMTEREQVRDGKARVKWSWVGNRSPLMGERGEAEWLLERLTRKLERELETLVKKHGNGEGKGSGDAGEGKLKE